MKILFQNEKFNKPYYGNPWITIELDPDPQKNTGNTKPISIRAIIDTGFTESLKLPYSLKKEIKTISSIYTTKIKGIGDLLFHTVRFRIIDQMNQIHNVESDRVIFWGEEYALLGVRFLSDFDCFFAIDGANERFTLATDLSTDKNIKQTYPSRFIQLDKTVCKALESI